MQLLVHLAERRHDGLGHDKHVALDQRLEVDEGPAGPGLEEDLRRVDRERAERHVGGLRERLAPPPVARRLRGHVLGAPRFARGVVGHVERHRRAARVERRPAVDEAVDLVVVREVALHARHDVRVDVGHGLARGRSVLEGHVEGVRRWCELLRAPDRYR
ncbi:unnamed protein product [Pelagomonas calceolata]|uniref:Uncharacterized protein n=1 Tax=Pelagomonas calceolata TaxID=35677 RepID=A0A8J2SEI7_9STRA|nr:unnamed protein product [Pelagomonas calceolata]